MRSGLAFALAALTCTAACRTDPNQNGQVKDVVSTPESGAEGASDGSYTIFSVAVVAGGKAYVRRALCPAGSSADPAAAKASCPITHQMEISAFAKGLKDKYALAFHAGAALSKDEENAIDRVVAQISDTSTHDLRDEASGISAIASNAVALFDATIGVSVAASSH